MSFSNPLPQQLRLGHAFALGSELKLAGEGEWELKVYALIGLSAAGG